MAPNKPSHLRPALTRSTITTVGLLLLAIGLLLSWAWQGRAQVYPDAPAGQFACLSYTPRSDSSRGATADIHAQIERDLQQLSARTRCVRTYSVMNGLDYVPVAARKLGMRVLLGIWIGSNQQANEIEINQVIATAKQHADVIDAIIVGNEVLLRREQTVDALYAMLVRVRTATQLPVTYADVWDFWLKNPKLAEVSDFVSIHILPYWDDQPIGVEHAMAHVQAIYQKAQQTFPGKRIYVGETGWPSAGRQREGAKPSLLNQARFTREFIALVSQQQIPYNFIEAYDQPWKKRLEGTVGGYWGVYDAQGREKFPLTGAVVADARWWRGPLAGIIAAGWLLVVAQRTKHSRIHAALAGFSLGCTAVWQWDYLWQSNRTWQEWLAMGSFMLLTQAVFLLGLFKLEQRYSRWWTGLVLTLLVCVAYINLGLVFDARYRDFPSAFLLLPTAMLLLNSSARPYLARSNEALLLVTWLILSSVAIAVIEDISNGSALLWCAISGLFGLVLSRQYWRMPIAHQHQRAEQ